MGGRRSFVLGMLALDLGVFPREMREVGVGQGLIWIAESRFR